MQASKPGTQSPPITAAVLDFDAEGTPRSAQYDDIYHSASGALEQAQHVFLHGNGLPERWQGRDRFVIVETGFGLGHNFLATWQAWREFENAPRLHFISVEKHPFKADDMATAHRRSGVPEALSRQLTACWPLPVAGFHRLEFENGGIVLTLLFGEAADMLKQCVARADAIFLDGFAPAKNPDMWSAPVFNALARMSDTETTLATWSVYAPVRQGLRDAGFMVEKVPGFKGKHWMLRGQFSRPREPRSTLQRDAIVIGAGLAGTGICERLATRGWKITLLEAGSAPAQGASGNIAGAFRPQPSRDDNLMARITRAGFLYELQDLARLDAAGLPVRWSQCGVLHVARDEVQARKQQAVVSSLQQPPALMQWLDAPEATARAGQAAPFGGWWFELGGWISPPSLCAAHLAKAGNAVTAHFNTTVTSLKHEGGLWQALNEQGEILAMATHLVLANAHDAHRLLGAEWLPLYSARGQVSHLPAGSLGPINTVVCGSGYLTPAVDALHAMGATFVVDDKALDLRESEHAENLDKLRQMLPAITATPDPANLPGRVSLRPITPDRLPFVGSLPEKPNIWLLSGFGARGLAWGMLCAELLAGQMDCEPLPLERELADHLSPVRYRPVSA